MRKMDQVRKYLETRREFKVKEMLYEGLLLDNPNLPKNVKKACRPSLYKLCKERGVF